jgi:hypothetical protein
MWAGTPTLLGFPFAFIFWDSRATIESRFGFRYAGRCGGIETRFVFRYWEKWFSLRQD